MAAIAVPVYIDPPDVEPYRYGLFGIAQDVPWQPHFGNFGAEWESMAEYQTQLYASGQAVQAGSGGTKTLDTNFGTSQAFPFANYAGVICGTIGYTPQEFEDRTTRILTLSGQHAAERALWAGGAGSTPRLNATGTHDVTGGTKTGLVNALGLLENWIADNYAGRAVVHAQRYLAGLAASKQLIKHDPEKPDADIWMTPAGSQWSFEGGSDGSGPAAAAPSAGTSWIYATGQLLISRGPVDMPADYKTAIQRTTNELFLISEQQYIIGIDGTWAAALVDLTV